MRPISRSSSLPAHPFIWSLPIIVVTILAVPIESQPTGVSGNQPKSSHQCDRFVWNGDQRRWTLLRENRQKTHLPISSHRDGRPCLWPEDNCAGQDDRIIDQLLLQVQKGAKKVVKIFPAHAMRPQLAREWETSEPEDEPEQEEEQDLPEDSCLSPDDGRRCRMTHNLDSADVIIFSNADVIRQPKRRPRKDQIWIAYLLESPPNTFPERYQRLYRGQHQFNWTASYRGDSDIVTPYAKFVPYLDDPDSFQSLCRAMNSTRNEARTSPPTIRNVLHREMIRGKRKQVAWFASNCYTPNKRLEYAQELSKYIKVDIFGRCGPLDCDKSNQTGCLEMLNRDYKFYLSFENSNSGQYITEKLFRNALGNNDQNYLLLPIVMGPARGDYELLAPPNSFVHVDDFGGSIERLANYLMLLDSDDVLYYSYFSWKTMGRFVDTKFMCRVCLLAHETIKSGKTKTYSDLKGWYRNSSSVQ